MVVSTGTLWIFTILYKATKDEVFLQAAKDAAAYIQGIPVGDDYAVLVPYLDSLEKGPSWQFQKMAWKLVENHSTGCAYLFRLIYWYSRKCMEFIVFSRCIKG